MLWPLTKNHHSALSTFATRQNLHVFTITTNLDLSILHSEKTSFTTGSRSYRLWWHFDAFQSALHNNTSEAYSIWHLGPCKSISAERLTLTSQLPHLERLSPSTCQSRSASPTINLARPFVSLALSNTRQHRLSPSSTTSRTLPLYFGEYEGGKYPALSITRTPD